MARSKPRGPRVALDPRGRAGQPRHGHPPRPRQDAGLRHVRIARRASDSKTLLENGLVEVEVIAQVSARLIVNRAAFKTNAAVGDLVEAFRAAVND